MDKIQWKKTNRLGIVDFMEQLKHHSQMLVRNELQDITQKLDGLKAMGVVKNVGQLDELKKKIAVMCATTEAKAEETK